MKIIPLILFTVLITSSSQILLKLGMRGFDSSHINLGVIIRQLFTPFIFTGLLIYALSALMWLYILSKVDVTFAYPFVSFGFILVLILGWLFLGEKIGVYRLAGFAFIIVGVVLVSFSGSK